MSRKDGGYDWFEINAVEPSRQLPLDEVRPQILKAMRDAEAQKQVAAKANELARQIDAGQAWQNSPPPMAPPWSKRRRSSAPARRACRAAAVEQIFGAPVGAAGVALADKGGRVVFKVTDATTPPLDMKSPGNRRNRCRSSTPASADDLFTEYVAGLQSQLGTAREPGRLRAAIGSGQ